LHDEYEIDDDNTMCMCYFCGSEMHLFNGTWVRHDDAAFMEFEKKSGQQGLYLIPVKKI